MLPMKNMKKVNPFKSLKLPKKFGNKIRNMKQAKQSSLKIMRLGKPTKLRLLKLKSKSRILRNHLIRKLKLTMMPKLLMMKNLRLTKSMKNSKRTGTSGNHTKL
jgi:hypothetical protein